MSLYHESVPALLKMLGNLDTWLDEAAHYAAERSFEPDVLLQSRLSPDMFAFTRQVQSACDNAKFIAARLAGQEPPKYEDNETSLDELRERVAITRQYLERFREADFEGAAERHLFLPFLRGGYLTGAEYLRSFAMPNFYFHLNMAYALLRQSGVKLGKLKYIGSMDVRMPDAE
jgi:hypothetical protein